LVVLAHLRRRWSLSGREEFGFLSPSHRACEAGFGAFWGSEMPIFHYAGSQKRNGGHQGNRTLHRTRSRIDRTRPVCSSQLSGARVLGFTTGASGPSWNRSVRSGTQRGRAVHRADRTRDASSHVRSDASGHGGSSLDSGRTPGVACPVKR
jgi:hypothetical protein